MENTDAYADIVGEKFTRVIARLDAGNIASAYKDEITQWMVYLLVNRGLSQATVEHYALYAYEFLLWAKEKDICFEASDNHGADIIEEWISELYKHKGNSATTRNNKLAGVKSYFDWRERFSRGVNIARSIRAAKQKRPVPRKFTDEQLRKLFNAPDQSTIQGARDYAMLQFMYNTGARRAEVAGLTFDQLVLKKEVGFVRLHGKGAKERIISFNQYAVEAIQSWLITRSLLDFIFDHDAVWLSLSGVTRGHKLSAHMVNELMKRTAKKAGIPDTDAWSHKMRSTFATALYDNGLDLLEIRKLLGHSKLETTDRYIDISDRQLSARLPATHVASLLSDEKTKAMPRYLQDRAGRRGINRSR